jgi:uncharacterized protein with PQ loop repeat
MTLEPINEIVGWIGGTVLSLCAVPQVFHTWRTKKAGDLSWGFLLMWFFGEVLTFAYIIIGDVMNSLTHFPLYLNYFFNTVLVIYLLYAKKNYK